MRKKYFKRKIVTEQIEIEESRPSFKQELKDVAKLKKQKNFNRLNYLKMFNAATRDKLSKLV